MKSTLHAFYIILLPTIYRLSVSSGADIRRLSVPRWVRNGTGKGIVLDCDYVYNENDLRLVVKWFFNDEVEPLYQWIPELNIRHVAGVLYGRLDMLFSINPLDPYSQYRAMRIVSVTPDLTGKYTCLITSLAGQDSRSMDMKVFVPAKKFQFTFAMSENRDIAFTCSADGVFPKASLRLKVFSRHSTKKFHPGGDILDSMFDKLKTGSKTVIKNSANSSTYDITLINMIRESQMNKISSGRALVIICILEIPGSPYLRKRKITYLSGLPPPSLGNRVSVAGRPTSPIEVLLFTIMILIYK